VQGWQSLVKPALSKKGLNARDSRSRPVGVREFKSHPLHHIQNLDVIGVHFRRLTGRKSKTLRNMDDEILIIELKNGKVYGGIQDGYEAGAVWVYSCKRLDKNNHRWIDHDIMIEVEGKIIRDSMPFFDISEIKNIFILLEEYRDIYLGDALQIYIDPHYKPIKGVKCNWRPDEKHSSDCDAQLHEALSLLRTQTMLGPKDWGKDLERQLEDSFAYVRWRLLIYGAKIP